MKTLLVLAFFLFAASSPAEVIVTNLLVKPSVAREVTEKQAGALIALFNALKWDGTAGHRCHHPAYRIQSLTNGRVTLDATVCFGCFNVQFSVPKERGLAGFTANDPSAQSLHRAFDAHFPAEKGATPKP